MRIIIYNSSSFGGCYDYGREIHRAFQQHPDVESVEWWVPENAPEEELNSVRRLFLSDRPAAKSRIFRQIHFLWRSFMNPFRLGLRLAASADSMVIFNDYEQLTAPFWVPFFRSILSARHRFAVILHDPDRDAYPPSLRWTHFCMKRILSLCELAFYHGYLPEKEYYKQSRYCRFLDLPHGLFRLPEPDSEMTLRIRSGNPSGLRILSIPGNIRPEKNYHLAIEALKLLPDCLLLIAGAAANARVDLASYRRLATEAGVESRVLWLEGFLSLPQLASVISESQVVLLNYAGSFTSQSGIFNLTIPMKKPVVVSSAKSGMSQVVEQFGIGTPALGSGVKELAEAVRKALEEGEQPLNWDRYMEFASWESNVSRIISNFEVLDTEVICGR
jgi:glycosyltransferase involved in cell wall biosynthesis